MAEIKCEMTGVIDQVLITVGATVEVGTEIVVIESMKSLITIKSLEAGEVEEIKVSQGDFIEEGETLALLK
ncbi:MAG: hypothetical protein APF81_24555 [Desulfosporosinus sp. BRH_c37]|nr:MAG: hypothetical protein APF81_24555 [Desulfosporosinus sp. BRH_c37]